MPTTCIGRIDLLVEIAAAEYVEHTALEDLLCVIGATEHPKGFSDLAVAISAFIPRVSLNVSVAAVYPEDTEGPKVIPQTYPLNSSGGIGAYGPIFVVVEDLITGVDLSTLEMVVNTVTYTQSSPEVTCLPISPPYRYAIRYIPTTAWVLGSTVSVSVCIRDKAGNPGLMEATV